jgi:hypothetical protein
VTQIPTICCRLATYSWGNIWPCVIKKLLVCLFVPVLCCYWGYYHTYNDDRNYLDWTNRIIAIYDAPIQGCDAGGYCAM